MMIDTIMTTSAVSAYPKNTLKNTLKKRALEPLLSSSIIKYTENEKTNKKKLTKITKNAFINFSFDKKRKSVARFFQTSKR